MGLAGMIGSAWSFLCQETALVAARNECESAVKYLVRRMGVPVDAFHDAMLMEAIARGSVCMVRCLCALYDDLDMIDKYATDTRFLRAASEHGHSEEITRVLMAYELGTGARGSDPLRIAIRHGHAHVALALIVGDEGECGDDTVRWICRRILRSPPGSWKYDERSRQNARFALVLMDHGVKVTSATMYRIRVDVMNGYLTDLASLLNVSNESVSEVGGLARLSGRYPSD